MRELWRRLLAWRNGPAMDQDVDEELRFHLEMKARETGDPAQAKRAVGSPLLWRERSRDAWGLAWADDLLWDLRYAVRLFAQSPGFTAVAVGMLALGLGINAMVFSITNAVLLKGFPLVRDNARLLYLTEGQGCCVSYPNFEDWKEQARSFEDMALVRGVQQSYQDAGAYPETLYTTEVTANTFGLVGLRPAFGRDFVDADEQAGAPGVVILRYGFWQRRYGGDQAVLGKQVRINGMPASIIGVMPDGFSFPQNQDLWLPLKRTPEVMKRDNRNTWFAVGRLRNGVGEAAARAEMETVFRRVNEAYPEINRGERQRPTVYTFSEFFIGPGATTIYQAMLAAVAFVLLIACANLANLLLGRAMGRAREISVRIALGAGRWRILRQLLIESVLLSAMGGLAGYGIARWGVAVYATRANGAGASDIISGIWFDGMFDYAMDAASLWYLAAVSLGTGLLFGLAPASRLRSLDVNETLKDGARASGGTRGRRLSSLLVTAEMALAVVLLAGSGVLVRSFLKLYFADFGFQSHDIITALIVLPATGYEQRPQQVAFFQELTRRLEASPGIEAVGLSGYPPAYGSTTFPYELFAPGASPGGQPETNLPRLGVVATGPDYFRALGQPLVAGRDIGPSDITSGVPVVIVNQRFARLNWPGEEPLGKRFRIYRGAQPGDWLTVIGVAPDIAQNSALQPELNVVVYSPYWRGPASSLNLIARTKLPIARFTERLRSEMRAMDPVLPIANGPFYLDDVMERRYLYRGVSAAMMLLSSMVALLLAAIGLYSVIAHTVGQRTQEIGVRMAVGATAGDVMRMVWRQGMAPVAVGLAAGVAASFAVNRLLAAQLVQVSPWDPLTLVAAVGLLMAAAMLGCWIPARRAMQVDPVIALRHE